MKTRYCNPLIYFIADPAICGGRNIVEIVKAAAEGGVTLVQLRNKTDPAEIIMKQAVNLIEILRPYAIPLIINDHAEIAHLTNADGLHLGQGDMSPADARKILGPEKIIGITAFEENHFKNIDPEIIDYAGTGPFYETPAKPGKPVLGFEKFKDLVKISIVPVVGIGGITPLNAANVMRAGAKGVAMMRAISESADPAQAACAFVKAVQ